MKLSAEDIFAGSVTIALHGLVGALLWFGMPAFFPPEKNNVVPVQAVFLDQSRSQLSAQKQEQARLRAEAEARRRAEEEARRKAEEAARRKAEEEARKQAEAEARRQAEAEAKRKAAEEAARKKAEAEARRKAEEAARKKRQQEAEQRFQEALAEEEAAIRAAEKAKAQAAQDAEDRAGYANMLASYIQRHWTRPPGMEDDFSCRIRIRQLPGGQIQGYELLESCGNTFLDASVENAIKKSDPLPLPDNPRVFERTLTLTFQP